MSVHERNHIPELHNTPAIGVNAVSIIFWFYAFSHWECLLPRLKVHNQNMTVAASAIAESKTVGDLS